MNAMDHNQSYDHQHHRRRRQQPQLAYQVAKATTAVTLAGSLIVLSCLTMAATTIGLVLLTPLLVIFSPVLIPALFTLFMILAGSITTGWLGVTATFVLYWMYRYVSGKHPIGSHRMDWLLETIAGAGVEVKHKAQDLGHQTLKAGPGGGGHHDREINVVGVGHQ